MMKYEPKSQNKTKIAFLGGDMRTLTVAGSMCREDVDIFVWGVDKKTETDIIFSDSLANALMGASAVILPLPSSFDGMTLNCSAAENKVSLSLISDLLSDSCTVVGGKIPKSFKDTLESKGIKTFDYFESESFQIKNAYTTAEAALCIAMNNLQKNVKGARFALTGYGRIAKYLSSLLLSLGAHVTIAARKESDLVWAESAGCEILRLSDGAKAKKAIHKLCRGYDIIFNTVPSWLFNEEFLSNMDIETLIIDLASSPGGVDIAEAKRQKKKVLWATSLPGKYAPQSAGELIADCVKHILVGEGVI